MKVFLLYPLLGSALLLTSQTGCAQSRAQTSAARDTTASPDLSPLGTNPGLAPNAPLDDKVYTYVEQMPTFPGGNGKLLTFFAKHYQLPKVEGDLPSGTQLLIRFVVDKTGAVRDPEILRGISYAHNVEALRVVRLLPRFQPGFQNSRPVNVYYTLPVILDIE